MTEAFPLIDLSGGPEERGRQYGRQAAARIRKGIGHYTEQLRKLSLDAGQIAELVRDYSPIVERFDASYLVEMQAIAQGANVAYEDIFMLNARTEVLKLAASPELRERMRNSEDTDGCTGVVVLPEASRDGELIHAQNWDWKHECAESSVVLRIRRDDGPDILMFTEAGAMGRSGLNSAGVALTANYLESDRDYAQAGVPLALIRRKALECEPLAMAMRTIYLTPKSGSNNMIVSHAAGIAIDFECAPDETFQVHAENGLLVHANHWVNTSALSKLKEMGVAAMPDSLYRDMRVRSLLAPQIGKITTDSVKAALLDDLLSPWSVCRPPRMNMTSNLSATVATIVLHPAKGTMEVAVLPAQNPTFTTYSLHD